MKDLNLLTEQSPCNGCTKRRVGCHNPETCEEWAEFVERADKERAARVKFANEKRILKNYIDDHKVAQERANRGTVRARIDKKHR